MGPISHLHQVQRNEDEPVGSVGANGELSASSFLRYGNVKASQQQEPLEGILGTDEWMRTGGKCATRTMRRRADHISYREKEAQERDAPDGFWQHPSVKHTITKTEEKGGGV